MAGLQLNWEAYQSEGAKRSLRRFCEYTSPWEMEEWQGIICDRLQRLRDEEGQRLLIHAPPQMGKSIIISQRLPAWLLGVKPEYRVRLACYNLTHAERFSKVNLEIMRGSEFARAFPDEACRVPKVCPAEEWSTAARAGILDGQPSFKALGLGSGFTGLGSDLLVIDDPYKNREEAFSETINEGIWGWWTDVVLPRLNPRTNVVVMFHRWKTDDLAGRLLDQGGWEQLRFPALADGGPDDPSRREAGQTLSPRYPEAYLKEIERQQGSQSFLALYQGKPVDEAGNMLKIKLIRDASISPNGGERELIRVYQGWDLAISEKTTADYTVGVTLGVDSGQNIYILDVFRDRMSFDETMEAIAAQAQKWGPVSIAIESVGYQAAAFQHAKKRFMLPLREVKPTRGEDKVLRAQLLADRIAAGCVFADKKAAWWPDFEREALAFPAGRHDDQVDAAAWALKLHPIQWAQTEETKAPYLSIDAVDEERAEKRRQQRRSKT